MSMGAADMLLDLGHSVTEAQSGLHALKLLETDSPFDVVVTDYAMPGMNGFELAQRIKERNPTLPIILATGYAELPADRSIEFGHLSKPYTSKDLASALEKAVIGTGKDGLRLRVRRIPKREGRRRVQILLYSTGVLVGDAENEVAGHLANDCARRKPSEFFNRYT